MKKTTGVFEANVGYIFSKKKYLEIWPEEEDGKQQWFSICDGKNVCVDLEKNMGYVNGYRICECWCERNDARYCKLIDRRDLDSAEFGFLTLKVYRKEDGTCFVESWRNGVMLASVPLKD